MKALIEAKGIEYLNKHNYLSYEIVIPAIWGNIGSRYMPDTQNLQLYILLSILYLNIWPSIVRLATRKLYQNEEDKKTVEYADMVHSIAFVFVMLSLSFLWASTLYTYPGINCLSVNLVFYVFMALIILFTLIAIFNIVNYFKTNLPFLSGRKSYRSIFLILFVFYLILISMPFVFDIKFHPIIIFIKFIGDFIMTLSNDGLDSLAHNMVNFIFY